MSEKDDPASGSFHVDKRIPVAMLFAIVLQTGTGIWWAASVSAAQSQALIDSKRLEVRVDRIESDRDDIKTRVIRIEEKLGSQNETLRAQNETLHEILRSVQRPDQVAPDWKR